MILSGPRWSSLGSSMVEHLPCNQAIGVRFSSRAQEATGSQAGVAARPARHQGPGPCHRGRHGGAGQAGGGRRPPGEVSLSRVAGGLPSACRAHPLAPPCSQPLLIHLVSGHRQHGSLPLVCIWLSGRPGEPVEVQEQDEGSPSGRQHGLDETPADHHGGARAGARAGCLQDGRETSKVDVEGPPTRSTYVRESNL